MKTYTINTFELLATGLGVGLMSTALVWLAVTAIDLYPALVACL